MTKTDNLRGPVVLQGGAPQGGNAEALRKVLILRRGWLWLASVLAAGYILLGLAVPLFVTLRQSVEFDPFWGAYTEQMGSATILVILQRTLLLAALSTIITIVIAFPVAYAMTLMRSRTRAVFLALLIFPYLTSYLVRTYAWIGLLGVSGPVVRVSQWLGSDTGTYNNSAIGVLVVLVHVFLPIMIMTCYVSMSRIDPSHLRAARTLGANHLESFWRVYAPQTKAGVVAGCVLVFTISAGMYATPALIGGPEQTTVVTLVVDQVTQQSRFGRLPAYPAALTVLLAVVIVVVLLIAARSVGIGEVLGLKSAEKRGIPKSRREPWQSRRIVSSIIRRVPLGSGRHHVFIRIMVLVAVVLVDGPFIYLIGMSFQPLRVLAFPSAGWSTKWYSRVFADRSWADAAGESIRIAVLATVIALIVGSFLALRTNKVRPFAGAAIVTAALVPLVVPAVMYATGVFTVFNQLGLIGDWRAIAVVHSVLALPFVYVNVANGLSSYDPRWDQAASSLGASPWQRLRKVTLPLLRPSLITGAFLAVLVSLEEFTVTLFLGGLTFQNLPLKFWSSARENLSPELAVVGVLLTAFTFIIAALAVAGVLATRRATKSYRSES